MARFAASAIPHRVKRNRETLAWLLGQAVPSWRSMLGRYGLQEHLVQTHYLRIWQAENAKSAATRESEFYRRWGIEARYIHKAEIAAIEPALKDSVNHAVLLPESYRVRDPYLLVCELFGAFVRNGGIFLTDEIKDIPFTDGPIELCGLKSRYKTDMAVIATGAHTVALLDRVGIKVPLMAERGYHLTVPGCDSALSGPICSAEKNVFITPVHAGLRIVGFSELGGTHLPPFPRRFESLSHHLQAIIPGVKEHLVDATEWMGMRPTLPDSLPVIDVHPKMKNLGFAFGHQHIGVTLAAATGKLMASKMLDEINCAELRRCSIDRF